MKRYNKLEDTPRKGYTRITGEYSRETYKGMCFNYNRIPVWHPKSKMICVDNGMSKPIYYIQSWCLNSR